MSTAIETEKIKNDWLGRLSSLAEDVRKWAEALEWTTRLIDKTLDDSVIGQHKVPVLLLQKGTTRIMLEPIARRAPGADGVVDLYLMPAYDDIASLYYFNGGWQLHYVFPEHCSVATIRETKSSPLTRESFEIVIEEMAKNAV